MTQRRSEDANDGAQVVALSRRQFLFGGLAATLLDSALGCAVHTTLDAGVAYTSLTLEAKFVRPITRDTGRVRAEAEVREAERARREIRQDMERLAEWRERLAPLVRAVRASIDETQLLAVRVGDGVRDALGPVTDALQALSDRLAVLAELAGPPAAAIDGESERALRVIEIDEEAPAQDGAADRWGWR